MVTRDLDAGRTKSRTAKKLVSHFTAHMVCGPCNHGWMNKDIESARLGPLAKMIDRTRPESAPAMRLPLAEQRTLALWAAKVALLLPYTLDPPLRADERQLAALRRDLRPPRGTFVWIGAFTMETYCQFWRVGIKAKGPLPKTNDLSLVQTTFVLGHVAFRVIQGPFRSPWPPALPDPVAGPWFRLWPASRRIATWPMPGWVMNRALVEQFAGSIPTRT